MHSPAAGQSMSCAERIASGLKLDRVDWKAVVMTSTEVIARPRGRLTVRDSERIAQNRSRSIGLIRSEQCRCLKQFRAGVVSASCKEIVTT